jgi:hypothetical protein
MGVRTQLINRLIVTYGPYNGRAIASRIMWAGYQNTGGGYRDFIEYQKSIEQYESPANYLKEAFIWTDVEPLAGTAWIEIYQSLTKKETKLSLRDWINKSPEEILNQTKPRKKP